MKPITKTELKQLIVESIQEYIKSIDEAGDLAALEAKIVKINEEIEARQGKISRVTEIGDLAEFVDQNKVKEIQREIALLERGKDKYAKQLEKMKSGKKDKEKEPIKDSPEKKELDERKSPLSSKEEKVAKKIKPAKKSMEKKYGKKEGDKVFYGTVRKQAK